MFEVPGVAEVPTSVGGLFSRTGFLLGTEAWSGPIEGGLEISASFSGKGNSRGGGIGRMLTCGPPISEESVKAEDCFIIHGQVHFRGCKISMRAMK